jgi:hypothetical protein
MTHCTQKEMEFQGIKNKRVVGKFNGGTITSDAGALLLGEVEMKTKIVKQFAKCFVDYRNQDYTEHSVKELVSQRIYGLAMGYEDLNDHDVLRSDPLLGLLSGKEDPTGQDRKRERDKGKALAGKSTLNRLELTKEDANDGERYKKIVYKGDEIEELFVNVFMQSHKKEPEVIVLDLDTTDDRIHGTQEGRYFHGYYGDYCYLPLYIFCGEDLLCAKLNTSDKGGGSQALKEVRRVIGQIRKEWKDTIIILRGDSDFSRDEIMSWSENNGIDYVFGLKKNNRLIKEIEVEMEAAKKKFEETGEGQRIFKEFIYETLKNTWAKKRRVIGKAEYLEKGENPRFIVTSLSKEEIEGQPLYEEGYCERGDMENRIKEQQLYLFSDRTSAHQMRANQLRLWFSSVAYLIMAALRRYAEGTAWVKAQCHRLRERLLKIGAQIRISVRRVMVSFASGYPYQDEFYRIYKQIRGSPVCVSEENNKGEIVEIN